MPKPSQPRTAASASDDASLYAALLSRDARFDGRFFVGVTSTGIYCRPVCRVRTPLQRHCRFFANAARAEAAGFRPCLRCRPELAPGLSLVDSSSVLARQAAAWLMHAARHGEPVSLPKLAARLGIGERHLRRIFIEAHGVSPIDFLTTERLLFAKRLLTDTALPIAEVALDCGYRSVRRFQAAFVERLRLQPGALRRAARDPNGIDRAVLRLRMAYRPPYDAAGMLAFFSARALPGIETIDEGGTLRRTLALGEGSRRVGGWIALRFLETRNEVELAVSNGLSTRPGALLETVRHALDLDADGAAIDAALTAFPGAEAPGMRLPGSFDAFETALRVILGQQISVAAARTLARRLVERFGEPLQTPFDGLARLFPTPGAIAEADPQSIGALGIVRTRVAALQALAAAVRDGRVVLHRMAPLDETLAALRALPGVGEWTAQLIAMRVLGWSDAFPHSDLGLLNALSTRDPRIVLALGRPWRPWRAYAVIRLWRHAAAQAAAASAAAGVTTATAAPGDGIAEDAAASSMSETAVGCRAMAVPANAALAPHLQPASPQGATASKASAARESSPAIS